MHVADIDWFIAEGGPEFAGKRQDGKTRDESDSGYGERFFMRYYRKHKDDDGGPDFEEAVEEIKTNKGRSGDWYRKLGDDRERQLERAWEFAEKSVAEGGVEGGELEVISGEELKLKRVEWLWKYCIPLGKTSLLAGDPDRGKSTVAFNLAARVTRGDKMPDRSEGMSGSVIVMSDEDDPADTIGPRLVAAGADMKKIKIVKMVKRPGGRRMFSLVDDLPKLKELVERVGDVRLILIDPVNAYLGIGKIDTFRNSDVRSVLAPMRDLAAECRVAILMITHTKKRREEGVNPIFHILDSIAFSAAPRSVIMVEPHPEDKKVRVFAVIKCNLVPRDNWVNRCFNFKSKFVKDAGTQTYVAWEDEPSDVTLDDMFGQKRKQGRPSDARDMAKEFLAENVVGEIPADKLKESAEGRGLNWRTVQRAADELGLRRGPIWRPGRVTKPTEGEPK